MESGEPLPCHGGHGGWRAALFIVAVGFLERIGFTGVGGNLITYLTGPLGMSTAAAAAGVNAWSGTVLVLPLVGALAADSRLGRYRAVLIAGVLYLLSLGMLTVSSMLQTAGCQNTNSTCSPPPSSSSPARLAFFYTAIYLLALAQGFHMPCSEALGADQFDSSVSASRSIFDVGSYASGMLVWAVDWAMTRTGGESWFADNLNRAHLDYFYWILTGLSALEVAVFLYFANRYAYRKKPEQRFVHH